MVTSILETWRRSGPGSRWWPFVLAACAGTALALFVSPVYSLGLAALTVAALVFLWVLAAPVWGLILLLIAFYNPLVAYSRLALAPWSYGVTFGLLGICAIVLVCKRRLRFPDAWVSVALGIGLLSLLLAISAAHGLVVGNAPMQVASDFLQVFELYLALGVTALLLWNHGGAGKLIRVVFLVLLVSVAWELIVYSFGGGHLLAISSSASALQRANLGSGGVLAGVSLPPCIFFPVLFGVFLFGRDDLKPWSVIAVLTGLGLSSLSIVLTFKRSIWGAEIVAVLFILGVGLFLRPARMAARIAGQSVLIGTLVLVALSFVEIEERPLFDFVTKRIDFTVDQIQSSSGQGLETRRFEYVVVWEEVADSLLLGRGLGREFFGYVRGEPGMKHFIHNTYLALLHRTGLVGLLAFLAIFSMIGLQILRRLRGVAGSLELGIAVGCLASFGSLAVQALTTGRLLTHPVAAYAGCLLGLALYLTSGGSILDRSGGSKAKSRSCSDHDLDGQ